MRYTCIIPGDPVSKARPRFSGGHAYTPVKTRRQEQLIAMRYRQAHGKLVTGAVLVEMTFYKPVPKSWSNARRMDALAGKERPTVKPDVDNLAKCVMDALNGVAWLDDKQVVGLVCYKAYSRAGCTEVTVTELEGA